MSTQPGLGYNFVHSGNATALTIDQPWLFYGDPDQLKNQADQANSALKPTLDIKKELDSLMPKGSQALPPESQQRLQQLQKQQQQLQAQAAKVQQQMEEVNQKASVFSPQMKQDLMQAAGQMQQASQSMSQKDPAGSAQHSGDAANRLEQLGRDVGKMMQPGGGGGGGMVMPSPSGGEGEDSEDGQDGARNSEDAVQLPGTQENEGEAFRKDILDAMKRQAPARYQEQVKRYYEELVK